MARPMPTMPRDYISADIDRRVRWRWRHRCGYCLSPQRLVMVRLEIEHIIPVAKGGGRMESNLWLSCPLCNRFKADRTSAPDVDSGTEVSLFNPRIQRWSEHFRWSEDGIRVIGLTPTGRATVALLHLARRSRRTDRPSRIGCWPDGTRRPTMSKDPPPSPCRTAAVGDRWPTEDGSTAFLPEIAFDG